MAAKTGKVRQLGDRLLSNRQAMERIKTLWKDGLVEVLAHAQDRMRQRHIDMQDIANLVRYGRVIEHSKPGWRWRYKVEGMSVDGEQITCIVEINDNLIIVTVID